MVALRTGILGGTFDPIHTGHVAIAEAALRALKLDRVLLLPSGKPPYKRCRAGRTDRMHMVERAAEGHVGLYPCDIEIRRKGESYAADTLRLLRERWPEDAFTYIIGADALARLGDWYGINEIVRLTGFAVVRRFDSNGEGLEERIHGLAEMLHAQIALTDIDAPPVSSGLVRERAAEGQPLAGLVPPAVEQYIRDRGLYLCDYSERQLLERLKSSITLHRYHHTLGVADTAQRLAARFGVDPARARLAGLLHDCAKSLPYGEMRHLVEVNVPDTDAQELDSEPVLHAPAGMVLARRDYGARDPAILQAIRRHTLGGPDMTAMDALIYVSDFIEPGRRPFEGLERARAAAETDIFEAMRVCASLTVEYLLSRGQTPHPRTLNLLNEHRNP